jgi:hypothetical protein
MVLGQTLQRRTAGLACAASAAICPDVPAAGSVAAGCGAGRPALSGAAAAAAHSSAKRPEPGRCLAGGCYVQATEALAAAAAHAARAAAGRLRFATAAGAACCGAAARGGAAAAAVAAAVGVELRQQAVHPRWEALAGAAGRLPTRRLAARRLAQGLGGAKAGATVRCRPRPRPPRLLDVRAAPCRNRSHRNLRLAPGWYLVLARRRLGGLPQRSPPPGLHGAASTGCCWCWC